MSEFLAHYVEILRDPAHLAVEVTLMVLVDGLFLGLVWPFAKRAIRRHDRQVHDLAPHDTSGRPSEVANARRN